MDWIAVYCIGAAVLVVTVVLYSLSVQSRKRYTCPTCHERINTEHLSAKRCGMCGAPLERKEECHE